MLNRRENEQSDFKDPRTYGSGMIRTHSGVWVNLLDPKPDMIYLADISHALSHLCRFGGHTNTMLAVATHSLAVSEQVPQEHKFAALLHDASEAYMIDLPSPIKALFPEYKAIETRLMHTIAERFNFQFPLHESIHEADTKALFKEWDAFLIGKVSLPYNHKYVMSQFELEFRKLKDLPRTKYLKL